MENRHFHFIGCGGVGMCCLCIIVKELGGLVSGSDIKETENTKILSKRNIPVFIGHRSENLPDLASKPCIVRSAAVKKDNPEYSAAEFAGCPCYTRGEFLAILAGRYEKTVAIAGSHGKTTVTSMISHLFRESGLCPAYMIGGKVCGWEAAGAAGNGDIFITESDESDGSLRLMKNKIGIITNVDDDHSWSVGGEEQLLANFAEFAANSEKIIYYKSEKTSGIFSFHPNAIVLDQDSEAGKITRADWGYFQRTNAALALAAAIQFGIQRETALRALESFPGVERRMSLRFKNANSILIEDYAHHPTEISASIGALREKFPDRILRVVFQPHRQARLEKYFRQFASELAKADEVTIIPVFAAWTEQGELSSENLAMEIGKSAKFAEGTWEGIADDILRNSQENELIAVIGAGDLDELIPFLIKGLANNSAKVHVP